MMPASAVAMLLLQVPIPMPSNILDRLPASLLTVAQRRKITEGMAARDYGQIESVIGAATRANPTQAGELNSFLGQVEFLSGRLAQAERAYQAAEAAAPLAARDRFTFAMALVRTGDLKSARAELDALNRGEPSAPLYLYWLGRIDYGQRLYDEAARKFARVIELDKESYRAYDNLGLALDMQGKNEEAKAAFEKAVELNRKERNPSPWPPQNLGYLLMRLQNAVEAEKALREALRYDSGLAVAHYHLGRVLEVEGRDEAAVSEYRTAISLDTVSPEACYSLGRLYRRIQRPRQAEAAFAEYQRRKEKTPPDSEADP